MFTNNQLNVYQQKMFTSNQLNVYPHAPNAAIPYKPQSRSLATFFINLANLWRTPLIKNLRERKRRRELSRRSRELWRRSTTILSTDHKESSSQISHPVAGCWRHSLKITLFLVTTRVWKLDILWVFQECQEAVLPRKRQQRTSQNIFPLSLNLQNLNRIDPICSFQTLPLIFCPCQQRFVTLSNFT